MQRQLNDYRACLDWVTNLAADVDEHDLGLPTPCDEFSVRVLLGHLVGTARRALGTAAGESTREIPHVVTDVPDNQLALTYGRSAAALGPAWEPIPAGHPVIAPWGPCTALDAVRGFTVETLVHGWDLAIALGQDPDYLPEVAERALEYVAIPERLVGVMYNRPTAVDATDGATTRLARLLGRSA